MWAGRQGDVRATQLIGAETGSQGTVEVSSSVYRLARPGGWFSVRATNSVRAQMPRQFTNSISPGRQVLSNQGCNGPYRRSSVFQPLPGIVCTQLLSLPTGARGPK